MASVQRSISELTSDAETGSSSAGYDALARIEWLKAVKDAVQTAQVVHLPVVGLYVHQAAPPAITPRSEVAATDPGVASAGGHTLINPRRFDKSRTC